MSPPMGTPIRPVVDKAGRLCPLNGRFLYSRLIQGGGMRFSRRRFAFEIPDAWWAAAGMAGFVAERTAYRAGPPDNPDLATILVPVDGLAVAPRGPGVPDFGRD